MADTPLSSQSPLSCHEAEREIDLLIEDGDLKETERSLLFAHVRACQTCKSKLEARRRQDVRLRQAFVALDTSPDFTHRVLDSLPVAGIDDPATEAAWAAAERTVRQENARPLGLGWLTRGYRLPAVLAALIAIGLFGAYMRFQLLKDMPEEAAQIQDMSGSGVRNRSGKEAHLETGGLLRRGDEISADTDGTPLVLKLGFRGSPVATVHLKPGAVLRAYSRNQYTLVKGEVFFQVRKDRPKEIVGERFKVDTILGCVQVLGTEFGIIMPSEVPQLVTVVVTEGTVEVVPNSGSAMRLVAGNEGDLLNAGGTSGPRDAAGTRMTWVSGITIVAANRTTPDKHAPDHLPAAEDSAPTVQATHKTEVDWERNVPPIDLSGHKLPQALTILSDRLGGVPGLQNLAQQVEALHTTTVCGLNIRAPISLGAAVRWLARESGLRFEAPGRFRAQRQGENLGPTESGLPPAMIEQKLHKRLNDPLAVTREPISPYLSELCALAGANLVLDRSAGTPIPTQPSLSRPWRGTLRGELEETLRCNDLEWAWYDGVIYITSPARIEALTMQARSIKAGPWIDQPLNPDWANAIVHLAEVLRAAPNGTLTTRHDLPALIQDVRLLPELMLSYRAGVAGERRLNELFDLLQNPPAEPVPPTAVLNEQRVTGVIRDCAQLAHQAEKRNVRVVVKMDQDFPSQCFVTRNTPLGQAFDWASRMQGLGLRNDAGALVMDTIPACYGDAEVQVVGLMDLLKLAPTDERILPQVLIRQAKAWYPDLFAGIEIHPAMNRVVLVGDKRHVFALLHVRDELCGDIRRAQEKNQPLDLKTWQPAWRVDLDKNLAEAFQGNGSGELPGGTLASVLRQSGQFMQARFPLIVEPSLMRARATRQIPALDVKGKTLGEVLAAFAQASGMRMVIEDEAIWFRENR